MAPPPIYSPVLDIIKAFPEHYDRRDDTYKRKYVLRLTPVEISPGTWALAGSGIAKFKHGLGVTPDRVQITTLMNPNLGPDPANDPQLPSIGLFFCPCIDPTDLDTKGVEWFGGNYALPPYDPAWGISEAQYEAWILQILGPRSRFEGDYDPKNDLLIFFFFVTTAMLIALFSGGSVGVGFVPQPAYLLAEVTYSHSMGQ